MDMGSVITDYEIWKNNPVKKVFVLVRSGRITPNTHSAMVKLNSVLRTGWSREQCIVLKQWKFCQQAITLAPIMMCCESMTGL